MQQITSAIVANTPIYYNFGYIGIPFMESLSF